MSGKELLTAQALADALDLSVETIWKYTRENKIPYVELGRRQYRYRLRDVIGALSATAVREKGSGYNGGPAKGFTYQDYLEMPEEPGVRFEILEGMLVKEPSPNVMHQRVSRRLQRILVDFFEEFDPEGEVFYSPLDVTFGDITVVQPDLLYVSGEQKQIIEDTRIDGPPSLIVEILSLSTIRKDRLRKMQIYQKAEVRHYWLLDPKEKTLECYALQNGLYARVASGMDDDVVEHPNFKGLAIDLAAIWQQGADTKR